MLFAQFKCVFEVIFWDNYFYSDILKKTLWLCGNSNVLWATAFLQPWKSGESHLFDKVHYHAFPETKNYLITSITTYKVSSLFLLFTLFVFAFSLRMIPLVKICSLKESMSRDLLSREIAWNGKILFNSRQY